MALFIWLKPPRNPEELEDEEADAAAKLDDVDE